MSARQKLMRPAVLGALLAVSVALNLFLAGTLAGRAGARAMHPPPFARDVDARLGFLSREKRQELRRHLLPPRDEMLRHHREVRALQQELGTELAREPPRREELERELAALRELNMTMQQRLHRRFVDTVLELPPAERRAMMGALLASPGSAVHGPRRFGAGPRHGGAAGARVPATTSTPPDAGQAAPGEDMQAD